MLKRYHLLGLTALGLIIPSVALAEPNSVVIQTIPVEQTGNSPDCMNTTNTKTDLFSNMPTSTTISINKQTQSINGRHSSTEVYQSSVSTNSGRVVQNDTLCVFPFGVPGLPR